MEVSRRLDALQEQQMELCETDSTNLADHITYWGLMRKEQVILHAARKNGIKTLCAQVVPSLQISKQKAKEAVEMHLMLQSLASSVYAKEEWTLTQTSREMWLTEPKETFKKEGETVKVRFDGNDENVMEYVKWGSVYYLNSVDMWEKTSSFVTPRGICYDKDGDIICYVDFASEANKFSETGTWDVVTNACDEVDNRSIITANSSYNSFNNSFDSSDDYVNQCSATFFSTSSSSCSSESILESVDGTWRSTDSTTKDTTLKGATACSTSPTLPTPANCSAFRRRSTALSSLGQRRRRRQQRKHPTNSNTCSPSSRNWQEVSESAVVLPVIFVRGPSNTVKCIRYRLRHQYEGLYLCCSTTWAWVQADGLSRHPWSKITVAFTSDSQRAEFLNKAQFPQSVKLQLGRIPW